MPRPAPNWKSNMAAMRRLPQSDMGAHLADLRQIFSWKKGVVACIEYQGWHTDACELWFGRRLPVVVRCVIKTVHWRCEDVVEFKEGAGRTQLFSVKQTRVLMPFGQGPGFHAAQKHAAVAQVAEALPNGLGARSQIEWCGNGGDGLNRVACGLTRLLGPAQQGIAAERDAYRDHGPCMCTAQLLQHPGNLLVIARVVGARSVVEFAGTATEMGHGITPAHAIRVVCKGLSVVAA